MKKKKRISKKEKLRRQKEASKLISFSQMSHQEQLNATDILAEI